MEGRYAGMNACRQKSVKKKARNRKHTGRQPDMKEGRKEGRKCKRIGAEGRKVYARIFQAHPTWNWPH
jgi:hypothetical protein